MNATFDFDRLLASTLDGDGPQTVPSEVVEAALARARDVDQRRPLVQALDRRGWPVSRRSGAPRTSQIHLTLMRALILVLIATALVALGIVGSALLREDSSPRMLESTFFRHFEYAIPAGSDMRVSGNRLPAMIAWVGGPDDWPAASDAPASGGEQPQPRQVRGVVIGSAGEAWSHGGAGRFMLRTTAAEFLTDLRDTASTRMSAIAETTFDGHAALTASLPGYGGSDIHVTGRMTGLSAAYVRVTMPSRLTVAEIDGSTVFVLIWARTAAELEVWLPVANEFVDSIHFVEE